jgi:hypothetical protein
VSFPVQLFTIKGNLVFMNNLYHKVAVASVCTALGFALGANEEAYSATFTLPPSITFIADDFNNNVGSSFDGRGDSAFPDNFNDVVRGTLGERASFAEFNIGSFSLAPNRVISSAVFQAQVADAGLAGFGVIGTFPNSLGIFGYVGNGIVEASDFEAGVFLSSVNVSISSAISREILNFDVTSFLNQRVSNRDAFAGFGIRALSFGGLTLDPNLSSIQPRLIIETADVSEPVPEPTTIFGSGIGLGLGGWLKRKKSSQQHKTTSQG